MLLTADPVKNDVSIRVSSDLFNKVNRKCDSLNKKWGIDIKPRDMVLSPDAVGELLSEDQENLKWLSPKLAFKALVIPLCVKHQGVFFYL